MPVVQETCGVLNNLAKLNDQFQGKSSLGIPQYPQFNAQFSQFNTEYKPQFPQFNQQFNKQYSHINQQLSQFTPTLFPKKPQWSKFSELNPRKSLTSAQIPLMKMQITAKTPLYPNSRKKQLHSLTNFKQKHLKPALIRKQFRKTKT